MKEEQRISFETAKLAKSKGFTIPNLSTDYIPMYIENEEYEFEGIIEPYELKLTEAQGEDSERENFYLAPTQSLLQKWLREVHKIDLWFGQFEIKGELRYHVEDITQNNVVIGGCTIYREKYEDALEEGLQEALKLI